MGTLILLRHGRSSANTAGVLAGHSPGVALDEHGCGQADAIAHRLEPVPLAAVVSSPLQRCRETVAPLVARRNVEPAVDDRFAEERPCRSRMRVPTPHTLGVRSR